MTAEDIIMKIEAEKVKAGEEDDKRVACSKTSLFSCFFIDPAFEAEATLADLRLRVLHGGQKLIAQPDDLSDIDIWIFDIYILIPR